MKRLAIVLLGCFVLTSCGADSEPAVNWSRVPRNQHAAIGAAVKAKDCNEMQTYFDGSDTSDVLDYLDWHMHKAGCY